MRIKFFKILVIVNLILFNFGVNFALGALVPFDINKIPDLYKNEFFISQPIGNACPIGQTDQVISNYAEINIKDVGSMGVCLAKKTQREQLEQTIKSATTPPSTGKISGEVRLYETSVKIPCQPLAGGQCASEQTPAGYIARLYQFGLMIAGFAAFASIIYGSLKYILSAGSLASQQDAKDQITQAVMGLLLLLGAFLILYTINPDLVNLQNPNLEFIKIDEITGKDQPGSLGEQKLLSGGATANDPLCKLAVNTQVNLQTNNVPGVTSGTKSTGYTCLNCKENAHREGDVLGVGGTCVCNTDSNYIFDPDKKECVKANF